MTPAARVQSVDALRGLIMVIMALDHVRDFFHADSMRFQPEDLARTSAAIFLTRWITHFCAPVFFFTAGIGAFFWLSRHGRTAAGLSRYLWTRGLWLIVLELTVLRFAFFFSLTSTPVILTVLWALGASMIALAALCRIPIRILAPLSIATIALHNLADPVQAQSFGSWAFVWNFLHSPGAFSAGGAPVFVAYPLIPWIAVMSAGFCFGTILIGPEPRRRQWLLWIGLAATAGFVVLRAAGVYGDPFSWTSAAGNKALAFLRCTKYPPSLLFLLMTLGPALLALAWFDGKTRPPWRPLLVIGRVPLFFFLAHFLLAHLLAIPFAWLRYGSTGFLAQPMPSMSGTQGSYPSGFGLGLAGVYAAWAAVVLALYPACVWFARLKERRRDWWLSYL